MKTLSSVITLAVTAALVASPYSHSKVSHPAEHPCVTNQNSQGFDEACSRYILGFLEGALLTDAAIIKEIQEQRSSFEDRAFKTRLRNSNLPPTYFAKFCLPESLDKDKIVFDVLQDFKKEGSETQEADSKIYKILKNNYKCSE